MSHGLFSTIKPIQLHEVRLGEHLFSHATHRGYHAAPHQHDALQVTILLAGRMHLRVEGADYLLGPERVIVLPAQVTHAITYLDGAVEFLCLTVPVTWLEAALGAIGRDADLGRAWVINEPFLWPLARQLAQEVDAPGPGSQGLLELGQQQLALLVARALQTKQVPPKGLDPRILQTIDRIVRSPGEAWSVESLATAASMSTRHFERCFKQAVGVGPKRFLLDVRMAAARDLLESSAMSITRVALETGFPDAAHFAKVFRRHVGVSPRRFRQGAGSAGSSTG